MTRLRTQLARNAPRLLRRVLQVGVLLFLFYSAVGSPWRNYKVAHNSARLVGLMEGDTWGTLYAWNEDLLELWDEDTLAASLDFLGTNWSSTFAGVQGADPILVGAHALRAGGDFEPALLLGLLVPLLVALLFGKVFCSHLCPMRTLFELGQLIRGGLLRLGVPLPHLRHPARFGGWILAGGMAATLTAGVVIWYLLLPYLGVGAGIFLLVTASTASGVLAVALGWLAVDLLVAPGYWCHNLCPQGWLLEQLGRLAPLRLIHRPGSEPCPTSCRVCEVTCPYALSPRAQTHRPACDQCGLCVTACPKDKLVRRLVAPTAALALAVALVSATAAPAVAHHNKGLPHYGYFDNYPQVPTEEEIVIQGDWEMGATIFNFQGYELRESSDTPNDVKFYVYLYDLKRDANYVDGLDFEIRLVDTGEVVSRFRREHVDEELVYSTRETLPQSGDYQLVALVPEGGATTEVVMPFYIDLDEGAIDWVLMLALLLPLIPLFLLALLGRTRRARARRRRAQAAALGAVLLLALAPPPPAVWAQAPAGGGEMACGGEMGCGGAKDSGGEMACGGEMGCGGGMACSGEMKGRFETEEGEEVMVMGGIPRWLFVVGVALLLIFSFVVVERIGAPAVKPWRYNLIKHRRLYAVVRSRWFQAIPQLLAVAAFGYLIYAGLAGSRIRNITPIAVWTIWWAGLIFAIVLLGPIWCWMCPWDGLANLVSRLWPGKRIEPLSLGATVPPALRNVYPAIALFALLSWAELGLGITSDPRWTAYLGLFVAALAVAGVLVFRGKAFCHYACPVGRINGIYANFAPVEIRVRKLGACKTCATEDCLVGNSRGYACPTGISLKTTGDATYCTFCTECIKTCPRHNVAFNLRPFGSDLNHMPRPRLDEAWLSLSLLALTLFHGFSMTTVWEDFAPGSASLMKWMKVTLGTGHVINFTLAMAVACGAPVLLYWLSCRLAARWTRGSGVSTRDLFIRYSYSLLPVAIFYHLAHNAMHMFIEGGAIVPLLSDPLGRGTDYFGTAAMEVGSLFSDETVWFLQVALIVTGHLFGILVAHRMSRRLFSDERQATRSLLPMLAVMVVISVCGLSLMVLDMNMRAGRM